MGNIILTFAMLDILSYNTLSKFYSVNLHHFSLNIFNQKQSGNSVDPDQMASSDASCSGSTVFSKHYNSWFNSTRVKMLALRSKKGGNKWDFSEWTC